jgi:hypothetical protein
MIKTHLLQWKAAKNFPTVGHDHSIHTPIDPNDCWRFHGVCACARVPFCVTEASGAVRAVRLEFTRIARPGKFSQITVLMPTCSVYLKFAECIYLASSIRATLTLQPPLPIEVIPVLFAQLSFEPS